MRLPATWCPEHGADEIRSPHGSGAGGAQAAGRARRARIARFDRQVAPPDAAHVDEPHDRLVLVPSLRSRREWSRSTQLGTTITDVRFRRTPSSDWMISFPPFEVEKTAFASCRGASPSGGRCDAAWILPPRHRRPPAHRDRSPRCGRSVSLRSEERRLRPIRPPTNAQAWTMSSRSLVRSTIPGRPVGDVDRGRQDLGPLVIPQG